MTKLLLVIIFLIPVIPALCQEPLMLTDSDLAALTLKIQELDEQGVYMTEDSLFVNDETRRLITDLSYRNTIYPEVYSWILVKEMIEKQEFKKAFWYLINLYYKSDINRPLVLKSILTYDSIFDMKAVLINVFYSYCFMDPEVGTIEAGIPEMTFPNIFEEKLEIVKELVVSIDKYRMN